MIGVVGLGTVGSAIKEALSEKYNVVGYDLNKKSDPFEALLETDMIFCCLPTPTHGGKQSYVGLGSGQSLIAIYGLFSELRKKDYKGIVVMKSTVLPGTCRKLQKENKQLTIVMCPEFMSASTAYDDFKNGENVIVGGEDKDAMLEVLNVHKSLGYKEGFMVTWTEAETIKYIHNVFLACKVGVFNELYDVCQQRKTNYQLCADLACKITGWINPRHTLVPGPDKKFGFGGDCFPKDIEALLTKYHHLDLDIIKSVILSNRMRRRNAHKVIIPNRRDYVSIMLNKPDEKVEEKKIGKKKVTKKKVNNG